MNSKPHNDERGLFARTFCAREFSAQGLTETFVQCNTSWNATKGRFEDCTIKLPPSCEVKLVRCTAGALWDVIVDLRPDSSTYLQHIGVELSAANRKALYIPRNVCPRISDLGGWDGGLLPDERILRARAGSRGALRRPEAGNSVAAVAVSAISEKDQAWDAPMISKGTEIATRRHKDAQ